uniref:Ionotropic receptor 2 n=1 Tax=Macrocentrus cingulum TaxID=535359 RepID=A0A0H3U5K2_9HYME|nr:ionotropic receptor 2 [Macrocentrus cingulum]
MWMILSSIFLFFLQFAASFNDFPSLMIANASMAVLIERSFYTRKILAKETSVFNEIVYKESLAVFGSEIVRTVQNHMNTSGLSIRIFHTVEVDLSKDYTVLLSIATCSVTWNLFEKAQKEKLVHFGITDPDCPRLPVRAALSIPLVDPGEELPQIFYDLKMTKKLTWTRVNIIHDDEIDSDVIKNVIDAFFSELDQPESTIHLATTSLLSFKRAKSEFLTKRRIKQILDNLPARTPIDDHFLVIVGFKTLPILIETARSLRLLHPQSQWLFVVPDMAEHAHGDVSFLIDYLDEGENVAFLYNDTIDPKSNSSCHLGATCHIKSSLQLWQAR